MPKPFRKSRAMIVHGHAPFNAEPPMTRLRDSFVTPQDLLYVRSHGDTPQVDAGLHRLEVGGRVARPLALSLVDLREKFSSQTVRAVMQCAGNRRADMRAVRPVKGDPWAGGAIGCADWTGVPLIDVLASAGSPTDDALHVAFEAYDICQGDADGEPYGVSISMPKARERDVLVAYAMNGAPLEAEHGFPMRIVVPGFAGARSPKWLKSITVQEHPSDAYYQAIDYKFYPPDMRPDTEDRSRGFTIEAMPLNSAICEPAPGASLTAGRTEIRGYAVSSDRAVTRIDLSGDGGRSWTQAEIEPNAPSRWSWTFWRAELDLLPGERELCVRAWDAAGQTQPSLPDDTWNFKGYLSASWHRVRVTVA